MDSLLAYQNKIPLVFIHTLLILLRRYFNYMFYVNESNIAIVRDTLKPIIQYTYAKTYMKQLAEGTFAEA